MDTHDYLLIRVAIFATMFVLWLAGVALAVYLRASSLVADVAGEVSRRCRARRGGERRLARRSPLRKAA